MSEDGIFLWINMVWMKKRYGPWLPYAAIYSHGDEWKVVHLMIITWNLGLPFKTPWGQFWRPGVIQIIPVSTPTAIFFKNGGHRETSANMWTTEIKFHPLWFTFSLHITHNNHSSHYGEHFKRSMTQSIILPCRSYCTMAAIEQYLP